MSATWPPPPDLASIKELVRDADTEEFITNGSPSDEYDGEAEALFAAIGRLSTAELVAPNILPHIERIWSRSFAYDDDIVAKIVQLSKDLPNKLLASSVPKQHLKSAIRLSR